MNGNKPNKLQPALIGGVALGVASAIPILNCLNCACCALAIGGGFLSAFLYLKDQPASSEAPYGDGALLGLMAGAIGAVVTSVVSIPFQLLQSSIGFQPDFSELEEQLSELPPEMADFFRTMLEGASAGGFSIVAIIMMFFAYLVAFVIFAMVGAIIGVALLHKQGGGTAVQPASTFGAPPPPPQG